MTLGKIGIPEKLIGKHDNEKFYSENKDGTFENLRKCSKIMLST